MKKLLIGLIPFLSGCSIYMASTLPIARPPERLEVGCPMEDIDRRFGYPIAMGEDGDGNHVEQIQFIDGVSIGMKVFRFCAHSTLDALSYCLWEFIGTPIEAFNRNYPIHVYYVVYDQNGNVIRAVSSESAEGARYSQMNWSVPFIDDLKVNKDSVLRAKYFSEKQ